MDQESLRAEHRPQVMLHISRTSTCSSWHRSINVHGASHDNRGHPAKESCGNPCIKVVRANGSFQGSGVDHLLEFKVG